MAQGNPYARFVEVMKRQGRAMNEPAMTVGIVTGVERSVFRLMACRSQSISTAIR